jgi:hypothetical protein
MRKAHANRWVVEDAQGACIAELDENNSRLLAKLKQSHLAYAEANATRNSLLANHGKLEEECAGLRAAIETLRQEKAGDVAAHEAEHKKF